MILRFVAHPNEHDPASHQRVLESADYNVHYFESRTEVVVLLNEPNPNAQSDEKKSILCILSDKFNDWDTCYVMNNDGKTIDRIASSGA